jgi:alpha-glucosidase
MQRWCELAAFAPVMRSHEGNRPDDNLQYDSTPNCLPALPGGAGSTPHLAPYVRHLCDEAAQPDCLRSGRCSCTIRTIPRSSPVQDQFLYGADLLVAPVIEEGAHAAQRVLPGDPCLAFICWTGQDNMPRHVTKSLPQSASRRSSTARWQCLCCAVCRIEIGVLDYE